jgi:hypothetical protein
MSDLQDDLKQIRQSMEFDEIAELKKKVKEASELKSKFQRRQGVMPLRFGNNDDDLLMVDIIDAYRKKKGWTWKVLVLRGVAEIASSENNAPLAEAIVNYMIEKTR